MFNFSITGVTISSFFDERRPLSSGKFPVKIRITYNRDRKYYNTGIALSSNEWGRIHNTKNNSLLNDRKVIQMAFNHIIKIVELLIKEDIFSFSNLNMRLGKGIDSTVNVAYQAKVDALNIDGKHNTSDFYKYSLRAVEGFGGGNIKFDSITIEWLKQFEKYLLAKEKSYTTIAIYIRCLQAIINEGKKLGVIKTHQYPFGVGKYVIPQHSGRNMALSIKDIASIMRYNCISDTLCYYRDLWIFSYLCNGANIVDICNLKYENIKGGNIEFYRQKTLAKSKFKKAVVAVVSIEMQKIIDKWGNKQDVPNNYIFPILKGKESSLEKRSVIRSATSSINHYLKKIGHDLGIGNISTYTARHSYATVLKRSGTNIAFISESLGHSDIKVTENYLASFENEERLKNSLILTDFSKIA